MFCSSAGLDPPLQHILIIFMFQVYYFLKSRYIYFHVRSKYCSNYLFSFKIILLGHFSSHIVDDDTDVDALLYN